MEVIYAAYGLQLHSSFQLPGMQPARACEDLPALSLSLLDPAELARAWSGAREPPEWRGRQGDGRELVIERGLAGDVLFSYGDVARFRLDAELRHLACAPRVPGLDSLRVLIGKVIPSISVMRGYEALHAAAVDSPDGVVAIMAPSGSGKSTLALELVRRGSPLFADDVLALSSADGVVDAHPGTAHMNLALDARDCEKLGETLGILAGERWLAASSTTAERRPLRMLCLLERGAAQALAIEPLQQNPLLLAPYMLGLSTDPGRRRSRFGLYSDLIASVKFVRVTGGLADRPDQLADLIEQSLAREPELVVGASG